MHACIIKTQRLNIEIKLFLLATLGLTGDALCGIGGGFGMGVVLFEPGRRELRGEPLEAFLSMPFKLLLRLSSPLGVPIGVGGKSLVGGFSRSSRTGDVALATKAGPGCEVSDTADWDRFPLGWREWFVVGRWVFATCGSAEGTSSVFLTEGFLA